MKKEETFGIIILVASVIAVAHGFYKQHQLPAGTEPNMTIKGEIALGGVGIIAGGFMALSKR